MEEVAHRIDEDRAWFTPLTRLVDQLGVERQFKAVRIFRHAHRLQPFRHTLGVAVLAPGRDDVATGDGVPGGMRPFYVGVSCHYPIVRREIRGPGLILIIVPSGNVPFLRGVPSTFSFSTIIDWSSSISLSRRVACLEI